jgi:hypothetical protein
MNLSWDPTNRQFIANLQSGDEWRKEMELVKAAGFKNTGPPNWVWYSIKSEPLTKLRENRPATLNINADARTEYTILKEVEDRNAATKALLKEQQKILKKKLKNDKLDAVKPDEYFDEGFGIVCMIVKPSPTPWVPKFVVPPPPETTCFICSSPVYLYEYGENQTPSCLWCQREVLDVNDI